MKKNIRINDDLNVEEIKKRDRTITSIYENGQRKILTDIETGDYFWSEIVFDENYLVVYSRGCMGNQIPLNIEAAYDIKEKRMVDLTNKKIKELLEGMLISKIGFSIANILSFINKVDLKILAEEKYDLKKILTSGNSTISDEEVVEYILEAYPILKNYKDLKSPLTVVDYNRIQKEIGQEFFWLHLIPQSLKFIEQPYLEDINENSNYSQMHIGEYENGQKVLRKNKNNQ